MGIFSMIQFVFVQVLGFGLAVLGVAILIFFIFKKIQTPKVAVVLSLIFIGLSLFVFGPNVFPDRIQYPFMLRTFGPADGPALPLASIFKFFGGVGDMAKVADIARDPGDVPPAITRTAPDRVKIELETKEVIGTMADGVQFNYWTFNDTVPGPLLRVREGDTVELTLKNHPSSINHHNIDLHAVTGPGGGATVTNVAPGESKTFTFKALNPGLYVYHCAHPNVATHMAHGMYGLILVEPKEGLSKVDREFYVMQGEFYSTGDIGKRGLQIFDAQKMLDGKPEYVVFNGRVGGAVGKMNVKTGDRVRLYIGNGGVNMISSFHVIGEIFDAVYPEASMGVGADVHRNIQTTLVPAGGAAIAEFAVEVPGKYILVDHALSRLERGAWGIIEAFGDSNPGVFQGSSDGGSHGH
jgi:nitrite reductase (NO-forming)